MLITDLGPQNEKAKTQAPSTKAKTCSRISRLTSQVGNKTVATGLVEGKEEEAAISSARNETRSSDSVGRNASRRVAMPQARLTCERSRLRR